MNARIAPITACLIAGLLTVTTASPAHADPGAEVSGGGCAVPITAVRTSWGNVVGVRAGMTAANNCRWALRARVHCNGWPTYYRRGAVVLRAGQISSAKCSEGDGYYGKQGYEVQKYPSTEWVFVAIP
ncbi:hypothetical protein ACIBG8_08335 [Nonomuraea sp. NPDC050556]|uniref:hypothetical protein n=1 Tax=Nonomuraea sp. NPDC050556 TaxID=3364369 RepID=UPI0037928ABC